MSTVNSIALALMLERGDQTDDAGQVAVIEGRINDALDEIAAFTGWNVFHARDTFNTSIGVAQYNMPAGLREIIQLRYTDTGEPIFMSTIQELARLGIKLEDSGRAQAWLEDGHVQSGSDNLYRIRLAPVPESVLTIEREFYYNPSDVASASHLPVQDNLITAIKHHVRAAMSVNDERFEEASYHRRSFEQILDRLLKQEQRKVASFTALRRVDLANTRGRRGPIFDPGHFRN
jgi:hypothetical protein